MPIWMDKMAFLHLLLKIWASLMAQMVKESACNAGDLGSIPGGGIYDVAIHHIGHLLL